MKIENINDVFDLLERVRQLKGNEDNNADRWLRDHLWASAGKLRLEDPALPALPIPSCNPANDIYVALPGWCESAMATPLADRPMLSPTASLVYELLLSLPAHRALTGRKICEWLVKRHGVNMDESTLRSRIIPALGPYGLENAPRLGYRIRPSSRPSNISA